MLPVRTILHPTDYSGPSGAALEFATALAGTFGAELVVCHVSPPPIVAAGKGVPVDFPTGEAERMAVRLGRVKPEHPGVRVTHQLLRGEPAPEIVRLAGEAKADLIVMGTHGRGGLPRLLLGSVAEGVMRHAPCPVVTVKAPAPDGHATSPDPTGAATDTVTD